MSYLVASFHHPVFSQVLLNPPREQRWLGHLACMRQFHRNNANTAWKLKNPCLPHKAKDLSLPSKAPQGSQPLLRPLLRCERQLTIDPGHPETAVWKGCQQSHLLSPAPTGPRCKLRFLKGTVQGYHLPGRIALVWDALKQSCTLYTHRAAPYNIQVLTECQPRHVKYKVKPLPQQG